MPRHSIPVLSATISVFLALACLPVSSPLLATDSPVYNGKPGTTSGQQCLNPKDLAAMVWVPAGKFLMGCSDDDDKAGAEEKPQHTVYLDGYWIYKHDVTVAEYKAYCKSAGKHMPKDAPAWGWKDPHPIVNITWQEARDYAKLAGAK